MATENGTKQASKLTKEERGLINEALELKITSLERGQVRAAKPIADAIQGVVNTYKTLQNRINTGELDL